MHSGRQDMEIFFNINNKLPSPVYDTQIAAMVCGFGDSIGYENLVSQLAERFETTAADVRNLARRVTQRDQSLNTPISGEFGESWLDRLKSDAETPEDRIAKDSERIELCELIVRGMQNLPAREQFIIKSRYFAEARQTFASIGRELNLSKDRVRQLETRALQTLKEFMEPGLIDGRIIIK